MADKLMNIPNDDTQSNPFCRLQLMVKTIEHSTNQNPIKAPKALGTSIINSLMSTSLPRWVRTHLCGALLHELVLDAGN